MATINYIVKGNENPSSIYLRFKHGRNFDFTKNTRYQINPRDWHELKKRPIQRDEVLKKLTTDLNELSNEVIKSFNSTNTDEISSDWLQTQIDIYKGDFRPEQQRSDIVTNCIQFTIDTAKTRENGRGGLGLSKSRINSYKNLLGIFKNYQGKRTYRVKDIDVLFAKKFLNWMLTEKEYSESYALKKINDLKTVCSDAALYGIATSGQLKLIKGGKPKNEFIIFLNPSELEKIEKTNLISKAHQNARKWLLLGCNIGQRGGDLLSLTKKNFVTRNGLEVIELTQQKTGKKVTIPILEKTREILKDGLPHPIAIQNFNNYIKQICKIAEIDNEIRGRKFDKERERKVTGTFPKWELITSHVCRRSFATNLYGELPTPLIMQITAHSTEKMFLRYIGKGSLDYAQQIADFYKRQSEIKAFKENTRTELSVIKNTVNE